VAAETDDFWFASNGQNVEVTNNITYTYDALDRLATFEDEADYQAFEKALLEAVERTHARLLAYCVMPNHWHLLIWPRRGATRA
jgi:hypothetical protein